MARTEGLESVKDFFEDVRKKERTIKRFSEKYDLSLYDFQLLSIIYDRQQILLKEIIQENLVKKNQVNKAVKHLYDEHLINKVRLPMDERTVQLSIKEDHQQVVEQMIKDFSDAIYEIYQ